MSVYRERKLRHRSQLARKASRLSAHIGVLKARVSEGQRLNAKELDRLLELSVDFIANSWPAGVHRELLDLVPLAEQRRRL